MWTQSGPMCDLINDGRITSIFTCQKMGRERKSEMVFNSLLFLLFWYQRSAHLARNTATDSNNWPPACGRRQFANFGSDLTWPRYAQVPPTINSGCCGLCHFSPPNIICSRKSLNQTNERCRCKHTCHTSL